MAGRLHYFATCSLDGYIEDTSGGFGWAEPDEEVHQFANDFLRPFGTYLYGRRMYETMAAWETEPALAAGSPVMADFAAVWQAADKVVYSTTLAAAVTARTTVERSFDAQAVRARKAAASADLGIGGADLAGQALSAGLVDDVHLLLMPVLVGGGKPALPVVAGGHRLDLVLVEQRRFDASGVAYLHHRVGTDP